VRSYCPQTAVRAAVALPEFLSKSKPVSCPKGGQKSRSADPAAIGFAHGGQDATNLCTRAGDREPDTGSHPPPCRKAGPPPTRPHRDDTHSRGCQHFFGVQGLIVGVDVWWIPIVNLTSGVIFLLIPLLYRFGDLVAPLVFFFAAYASITVVCWNLILGTDLSS
jgi:hypothetical protein